MRLSEIDENTADAQLVGRLLFGGLEYSGDSADLIMVLGSRKACEYRVPRAAELFHAGKANRLIFCGGKVQRTKHGFMPEYEAMLITAEEFGISREVILAEKKSLNTAENFRFAGEIISENFPHCRRIILVTTAYHMRRALLFAERILPQYEFIPCSVNRGSTAPDNWQLSEKGRRTAYGELKKLKFYAENGYIQDTEIK
jgi:uncharacterized SAM-binding protein YcdF (DUF218 family)